MLLIRDHSTGATALAAGALVCPHPGCGGVLGPWGHARTRHRRITASRFEAHTPRRTRCRSCERTQVLITAAGYPRRADTAENVGQATLAAANGVGSKRIAVQLGLPATTVRDWLRRTRLNADRVRAAATVAAHRLDPMLTPIAPTGTVLGDMVEAIGRAVQASIQRLGPLAPPWHLAVWLTGGAALAPPPRPSG